MTSILWLAIFNSILAQVPDPDNRPDASSKIHRHFQPALNKLNLTDAQERQVREILQSSRLDLRVVVRNYLMARRELEQAIRANPDDEDCIRARSAQLGSAMTEVTVKRAQLRSQLTKVLTPSSSSSGINSSKSRKSNCRKELIA